MYRSSVALPLLVAYDWVISPEQFRTFDQGKFDLMLFKAVVLDTADASGLVPYDLSTDSATVCPIDFVTAAEQHRSAMQLQARNTATGLAADVDLKSASMVVFSGPFDPSLLITVEGMPAKAIVANFEMNGATVSSRKHTVEVRHVNRKPQEGDLRVS